MEQGAATKEVASNELRRLPAKNISVSSADAQVGDSVFF